MRAPSLTLAALALLAAPAAAELEIVELKDGRVIEAKSVSVKGDRLHVELSLPDPDQKASYTIPLGKVVPEFVYYAWAGQIADEDLQEHLHLAAWARKQGLFRHAWRTYGHVAARDAAFRSKLGEFKQALYAEEATFNLNEAWRLFRAGEVKAARVRAERIVEHFQDSAELGRAKGLLNIIREREQFLSEQKKQEEIAKRARRQKREMDRVLGRVEKANRQVERANFHYPGHALRRLAWAAYTYRRAIHAFADLLAVAEVDELRLTIKALLSEMEMRLVTTFLKLGDLRFLVGDPTGALEAAHEVLAVDPANRRASDLRDRVLDAGGAAGGVPVAEPAPRPLLGIGYYRPRYHYRAIPGGYVRHRPGYHAGLGIYVLPSTTRYKISYGYGYGSRRFFNPFR